MEEIKHAIIAGAVPILVMLIGWTFSWVRVWLDAKLKNEIGKRIACEAFEVVAAVGQAVGDDLKEAAKDGKLSEAEKAQLKATALNALKDRLKDIPRKLVPEMEKRLSDAIEAAVGAKKQ